MSDIILQIIGWLLGAFWLWMLFDCIRNEEDKDERTSWFIILMLLNVLIAPIYYMRAYRPRKNQKMDPKQRT
jgi:RsiW-degrading membrane proteinase PrsW (M82 family)